MTKFKPKNPVKTLIAILAEGECCRDPRDRVILWEIRYETVTGAAPKGGNGYGKFNIRTHEQD